MNLEDIQRLETGMDLQKGPLDDLIELAHLYLLPGHSEDDALRLLELVIKRDSGNSEAKLWLAYVFLHYVPIQESFRRAKKLLESIIETGDSWTGAAYHFLDYAEWLIADYANRGDEIIDRRIALLEASVAREPEWVLNRILLAHVYEKAGRYSEAMEQLEKALKNVWDPVPDKSDWSERKDNYESWITARAANGEKERISGEISRIRRRMK